MPEPRPGLHRSPCSCPRPRTASTASPTRLLEEVAGGPVEGLVGDPDPFLAVQDAVNLRGFDELIVSTLSPRVSRWLRLDLPRRLTVLGIPITTVTAKGQVEVANAG